MSVITHVRVPADSFELGRILGVGSTTSIELEDMVPLGEKAVPFLTVHQGSSDSFEASVRNHPSVHGIRAVSRHDDRVLYALDWAVARDILFQGFIETDAHLLSARGTDEAWEFELRFPDHAALSAFRDYCTNAHVRLEVRRVYNPTRPGSGPWYGLTDTQRDTLVRAVRGGYYAIPRETSTMDLADEFDVSDQAVTERLRRAIVALVENTIIVALEDAERDDWD